MNTEKLREEFEAWVRTEWPAAPLHYRRDALPADHPQFGNYVLDTIQGAWTGWQASRAALVVELPPEAFSADPVGDAEWISGSNEMRSRCRAAIEAADLTVKE
jgi:hypothetical protein